jgi:DNA-binding transcriptional MerR regulator
VNQTTANSLSIGDFSRATHLSIKTLRHYHQLGLLEPGHVDPHTGYRRYGLEQIPLAQVIRRFRNLDMPLEEIRSMLAAPDPAARTERIAGHLARLEADLRRTEHAVASLRGLLDPPPGTPDARIESRSVGPVPAAAITAIVDVADSADWLSGALGELCATLAAQGIAASGSAGGVYADELFTRHRGQATVFVPCDASVRPLGRIAPYLVPAAELAVIEHAGPPADVDRAYGALAAHVTRHALAVDGPLREYYLVGRQDTPDPSLWRTEVCWPIFRTV